jgi:phosphatidate cytidylyltransferase
MSNIVIRALSGALFVGLVIGAFLWGMLPTILLLSIFMIIGLIEFYNLFPKLVSRSGHKFSGIFLGILIFSGVAGNQLSWWTLDTLLYLVPILFLPFVGMLFSKEKEPIKGLALQFMSWVYVVLPFLLMVQIYAMTSSEGTWKYLIGLFVIVWTNDTFAYLSGRAFGRTKLFERISPNKTWEGTIGGFIMAISASLLYGYFQEGNLLFWGIAGAVVSPSAVLGDLIESKIKRTAGVKDTGAIMPGHGGVLDRFDAVMFATPFFFLWISIAMNYYNFL